MMLNKCAYLFFCIIIILYFCGGCKNKSKTEKKVINIKEYTYQYKKIPLPGINETYDEYKGLNKPSGVKINPVTNELVVCDYKDNCLYVFSEEGKYKYKIGQRGQGPGDFLHPQFIFIDSNGNIYVYEEGNERISIFDKTGKHLKMFRVPPIVSSFVVNKEGEIVLNAPDRLFPKTGYYFTIISPSNGEVIREIAKIHEYKPDVWVNITFAYGIPVISSNGNYVLFIRYNPIVKIFDKDGNLLSEKSIEDALDRHNYTLPENQSESNMTFLDLYYDISYKNGYYYILIQIFPAPRLKNSWVDISFCQINDRFEFVQKIIIPDKIDKIYYDVNPRVNMQYDISQNGDIFLPLINNSEVNKYIK